MILFIANFPDAADEPDGMMQRVLAIDAFFASYERVYLHIAFFGNVRLSKQQLSPRLFRHRANFFLHFIHILRLGLRAKGVYVHSVHNSFRALPLYLLRNVITDLHGVFSEELSYCGKSVGAWLYERVEGIVVRAGRAVVTVTNAMADYYQEKYPAVDMKTYTVPIFDQPSCLTERLQRRDDKITVVYAGGGQKWQNVDLMLHVIKRAPDTVGCVILTGDLDFFHEKLVESALEKRVRLLRVPKNEVYAYYAAADFGFVLRDNVIVNRVACPTKLVEYLSCGVIPVVIQPQIGDFADWRFSCLTVEQFLRGEIPVREELEQMRQNNRDILERMRSAAVTAMHNLVADFTA